MVPAAKPPLRMVEFIALLSLITSLTAVSIDAMLPALPDIARSLAVSNANDTQLVVSLFILGMVFGELIFGPLSDAIGRKKAILAGLAIYCIGTVLAMTALSLGQILIGRIIMGIGVSGPKIASRALVRDQFEGEAMARIMSYIFMVFILVPMLAPSVGQIVLHAADWRAIFLLYLGFGAVIAVWLSVRQAETLPPERRIPLSYTALWTNTQRIVRHRKVMAYTAAAGLIFGGQLLYLSLAQAIFHDLYGIEDQFPLYFALLAFGIGLSAFCNSQLVQRFGMHRLSVAALIGLIASSGTLAAVAATHGGVPPFTIFMALCFAMFCCLGTLFGNLNAMAMQSLGRVAGLGASLIASMSSLVAVIMAVSIGRFYDQTALPLALGFLLAATVTLLLVLFASKARAESI